MTRPAYIISHTHWDREWYRTFQQFRLDLVRVIDDVLDTLETDAAFTHFLLDGQTIVIEDYLAMRPERAGQLGRLIADGRIGVGPWYCHPDLFLVSGESIVRNLMLGTRMASSYGNALMVGYIPDQFGHTAQLPQIFQGCGIASAVLWRGVDARYARNENWWEGPDGSRVFVVLLAQTYCNAQALPLAAEPLAERLRQLSELLARNATGPGVLLMNGCDHLPIQPGLPAALRGANCLLAPEWNAEQVSLDTAIDRLRDGGDPVHVLHGELRSPATAHLLPGVLSMRTPLKRRNVMSQLLLERNAEPWSVWASVVGGAYPLGELREAWKMLLQNQPHDSICGCSIDQVCREMHIRYDAVHEIGEVLVTRALGNLATHVDTRLSAGAPAHTVPLVVFNPSSEQRTERVRLTIELPGVAAGYDLVDDEGQTVPHVWQEAGGEPSTVMPVPRESIPGPAVMMSQLEGNRIMGMGIQDLSATVTDAGVQIEATVGDNGIMTREQIEAHIWSIDRVLTESAPLPVTVHIHRNARHEIALLARDVPPHGYRTVWLRPSDDETLDAPGDASAAPVTGAANEPADSISNEFLTVRIEHETGSLIIVDRASGRSFGPCNVFVDGGDAGDTYTYAPPEHDHIVAGPCAAPTIETTTDALGSRLHIRHVLRVPARLTEDRTRRSDDTTDLHITSVVTLTHGCPRLDFATTVTNTAADHRLRVTFQTPFEADHVHVDQAFDIVRRPTAAIPFEEGALEDPVAAAPQQNFVIAHDADHALVVANVGLPEYEPFAAGDGTTAIALTLLRCVGWLSRDDLTTRRGPAGPALEVPEAQCPGTHTFTYSLIPAAGPWRATVPAAYSAADSLHALATTPHEGPLPSTGTFLHVEGHDIRVSAIKGAEDGHGYIVRLYNTADAATATRLTFLQSVSRCERVTLDERPIDVLHNGGPIATINVPIGPHKIETLRLIASPR